MTKTKIHEIVSEMVESWYKDSYMEDPKREVERLCGLVHNSALNQVLDALRGHSKLICGCGESKCPRLNTLENLVEKMRHTYK